VTIVAKPPDLKLVREENPPPVRGRLWQRFVLAALNVRLVLGVRRAVDRREWRRQVWSDSTQSMGIRFGDRIRDVWRRQWIRLVSAASQEEHR